jgi:hypothetical protein
MAWNGSTSLRLDRENKINSLSDRIALRHLPQYRIVHNAAIAALPRKFLFLEISLRRRLQTNICGC